jgi:glutamate dehydrogenase (NAD(P)+)
MDVNISNDEMLRLTAGADEVDLVNSGLEETMATAYSETRDIAHAKNTDLRTAAFINAIDKVAVTYAEMGIFP